jgi:periplasmic protein TonB
VAPDDLRDFPLPDRCLPEDTGAEEVGFAIDPAVVAVPETAQREPVFQAGPVMIGFDGPEAEAEPAEPEPPPLDLARAVDEPELQTAGQDRRDWIVDLTAAAGVHLVSFLVFMYWTAAPAEIAPPIPVQLVLEEPRPKPELPPRPKPETRPPPGRLASTDIGDPTAKPAKPAADSRALPAPELVSALPRPAPRPEPELKLLEPVVRPAAPARPARAKPIRHEAAARSAPHPSAEQPWGRIPGPTATTDEYLAYANALIRHNQEMIPPALLKGRNGTAVISILVLADGTIAQIAIKESSGYPEIDERAERMIAAVKRFPPLPQWFQGTSMLLSYHMLFGDRMVLP